MSSRAGRRASGSAIARRSSSRSGSVATTMIARCRGAAGASCEAQGRVMAKDRLLELLQSRARLDAELVDEQLPRLAIELERLDLAT